MNAELGTAPLTALGLPTDVPDLPLPDAISRLADLSDRTTRLPTVTTVEFLSAVQQTGPD